MKTINKIFLSLGVAATAFGFSSCVGDLDLEPTNPTDITNVSGDMDRVFADLYLGFATYGANGDSPVKDFDGGMASFQRALSIAEEYPTDEMAWLWDPATYGNINYGLVNPSLDCVFGFYSRLIVNIALCNDFIQSVDNGKFALDEAGQQRAVEYRYQARILRGLCYYYMLSFYDKIPYADEETTIGSEPRQLPRAEVYRLVTADLEEVVANYNGKPYNGQEPAAYPKMATPYYGFVGLDAADAILMKIYLNGEVFAGQADYTNAYRHAKNIIDRLGKGGHYGNGLARSYQALFGCNNEKYVLGNGGSDVNEIIIPIVQDDPNLLSYQGSTYLLTSWIGTNGVEVTTPEPSKDEKYKDPEDGETREPGWNLAKDADGVWHVYKYYDDATYDQAVEEYNKLKNDKKDGYKVVISEIINNTAYSFDPTATGWIAQQWYNAGDGWKCLVARKSFVRKFEWNDVAMTESDDMRTALWQTAKHGFTSDNVSLVGDDWGKNGYLCPKYSNWAYNDDGTIDYVNSPMPQAQTAADYAIVRLAEVYLSAAEAILMGSEDGTQAEALQYVNYIRERAYGDTDHNWTSLNMQSLRDERCRELYQENVRRTDLIRWNLWCTGYTWEWKGNPSSAAGTNLPEYTKLYPIPSRVMTSSSFEQTTGY